MEERVFYITEEDEEERIDKFLVGAEIGLSRSFIQKLIKESHLLVNGKPVKASYIISVGDEVVLKIPDAKQMEQAYPEPIPLNILYEDSDVIVIDKPKGMVVHPVYRHCSGTLVNALLYHCGDNLSGINGVMRPGIVHRIDRDTTGVLVVCKNDAAHAALAEQFKCHSITRRYHAIVYGEIKEESGTVDAPIGRNRVDRKKMTIIENGRHAVTHYRVLARGKGFSYIECRLETGRTHQIRVHMASIRHPLLGDIVYGPEKCPIPQLCGQTLHAKILGFEHPTTKEYMEFYAPLPEYFIQLIQRFF